MNAAVDQHKGIQVGFRADRWRLVNAIDAYAATLRHSRNTAMILLIEKCLAIEGINIADFPDKPLKKK